MKKRIVWLLLILFMFLLLMPAASFAKTNTSASNDTYSTTKIQTYVKQPKITSVVNKKNDITVKWNKVTGATAYRVYRKVGTGSWKRLKTTTANSVSDTKVNNGKKYEYKVVAVKKVNGKTYKSEESDTKTMYRLTRTPVNLTNTKKGITVKWNKNIKVTGHEIKYQIGSGEARKIKVDSPYITQRTICDPDMKKGKKCKVYVRAYKTVGKNTYYSAWSVSESIEITKNYGNSDYVNIITVEGVTFDMREFPKKVVLGWDELFDDVESDCLSVIPQSKINPADIKYVIDNGKSQLLCSSDTPNILQNHPDYTSYCQYYTAQYVSDWNNMIAYVTTSYEPDMYLKYRVEIYPQLKTGSFPVSVYYKGKLIQTTTVTVKHSYSNAVWWRNWVNEVKEKAWTDDMVTPEEKLYAIEDYIHSLTYDEAMCNDGAAALLFAARDMGLEAFYRFTGPNYDYEKGYGDEYYHLGMAFCGGHVCTLVKIDGEWIVFEANGYHN